MQVISVLGIEISLLGSDFYLHVVDFQRWPYGSAGTKYQSADLENETKRLIEISRSSLRISAQWSRFQLSDLQCSVLLAPTYHSLSGEKRIHRSFSFFLSSPSNLSSDPVWGDVYNSIIPEFIWRTKYFLWCEIFYEMSRGCNTIIRARQGPLPGLTLSYSEGTVDV